MPIQIRLDRIIGSVLAVMISSAPGSAVSAGSPATKPPAELVTLARQQRAPLVVWAVNAKGQKSWGHLGALPHGVAAPERDLYFHAASVTKPIVAATVVYLAQRGLVDLDAPITKYLSEPPFAVLSERGLTVRQLLGHRSGLKDFDALDWDRPSPAAASLRESLLEPGRLVFETAPGGDFNYVDLNYNVLGVLIERISGESFGAAVASDLLVPNAAPAARLSCIDVPLARVATPHALSNAGEPTPSALRPFSRRHSPSGGLCISARELADWGAAYLDCDRNGAPLNCRSVESMYPQGDDRYGLGWYDDELGGVRLIWHDGSDVGYAAGLVLAPDQKVSVAVLTNFEFASAGVMANMLMAQALGRNYVAKKAFPAPTTWSRYAGMYFEEGMHCARLIATPEGLEMRYQEPEFPYELTRARLMPKPEWGRRLLHRRLSRQAHLVRRPRHARAQLPVHELEEVRARATGLGALRRRRGVTCASAQVERTCRIETQQACADASVPIAASVTAVITCQLREVASSASASRSHAALKTSTVQSNGRGSPAACARFSAPTQKIASPVPTYQITACENSSKNIGVPTRVCPAARTTRSQPTRR